MKNFIFLLLILIFFTFNYSYSQFRYEPKNPTKKDSITIYYNPFKGSKELIGVDSIYIYCGLITTRSENKSNWQYIAMQWGDNNPKYTLKKVNDTCYYFGMNLQKYFGYTDDELVYRVGMYFRDKNYKKFDYRNEGDFYFVELFQEGYNYKSYSIEKNQLIIKTDLYKYTLDLYNDDLIKLNFFKDDKISVSQKLSKYQVGTNKKFELIEKENNFIIEEDNYTIVINKFPVAFSVISKNDSILKSIKANNNFGWHFEYNPESRIYGNAKTPELDLNNTYCLLYNKAQYMYDSKSIYGNCTTPFFISSDLFSLFFDSPAQASINFGDIEKGIGNYYNYSNPLALFIQIGNTYEELISKNLTHIAKPILPTYWTLGFLQSNYGFWNQYEILNRLPLFRKNEIPCEAIMVDYFWMGGETKIGDLDWDYTYNYPDPQNLLKSLREYNMKCVLISEPYITVHSKNFSEFSSKGLFTTNKDKLPYLIDGYRTYSLATVDIFNPKAKEIFWNIHKKRLDEGVSSFWYDLSEPEFQPDDSYYYGGYQSNEVHNIYPYLLSEMYYENYIESFPNERPVIFSRGGFSGIQKYGTIIWTGDCKSSFKGLKAQIPIMLGLGINGINSVGSDVGGFVAKEKNSLLYARWVQFSVFAPILRAHSNYLQPPEPFYHDEPYLSICKKYINLRYRLLPYIYTLFYETTISGRPVVMQMDYFENDNKILQNNNEQYFFGENFIVAPILDSIGKRVVNLPKGYWYEFANNKRILGGKSINVEYDINDIPVFVRAGAIIPTTKPVLSTELYKYDNFTFLCYPDSSVKESFGKLYVDDGHSLNSYKQRKYELIDIKMLNNNDKLEFDFIKVGDGFAEFSKSYFELNIKNIATFETVILNNKIIPKYDEYATYELCNEGFYFNRTTRELFVKFDWNHQEQNNIEITNAVHIKENQKALIYPNPTNKICTLSLPLEYYKKLQSIDLYNSEFQKLNSVNILDNSELQIDFSRYNLPTGLYFIEIKSEIGVQLIKIIYER